MPITWWSTCGGVGYRLAVSAETLRHVPAVGKEVLLHTHMVVRDDALPLYGFATEEERELFLMLIGVQSVGPKVALAVLSGGPPRELLEAVAAGDTARLQAAPGRRQAHRRADHRRAAREGGRHRAGGGRDHQFRDPERPPASTIRATLAREGLLGLGYSPVEVDELLDGAEGERPEDLIAHALRTARR